MKRLALAALFICMVSSSFSQSGSVYRPKVMYNVTHVCQREQSKEGLWNAPYNCKNTAYDLIIKNSRVIMYNDTGKALTFDFEKQIHTFDDIILFNTYKDRMLLKAVDQDGKECYLFFISNNDDFYLVADYDGSATLLYLSNAMPMK